MRGVKLENGGYEMLLGASAYVCHNKLC